MNGDSAHSTPVARHVVLRDSLAIKHLLVELVDEGPAWCERHRRDVVPIHATLSCCSMALIPTATNVLNDRTMSNTKTANNVAVIEARPPPEAHPDRF